jgi:hypothetical protein
MFKIEKKNKEPFFEKEVYPADIEEFYVVAATREDGREVYMSVDFMNDGYVIWTPSINRASKFHSLDNLKKFQHWNFNNSLCCDHCLIKDLYYKLVTIITEAESLKGEPLEYQEN